VALEREKAFGRHRPNYMFLPGYPRIARIIGYHQAIPSSSSSSFSSSIRAVHAFIPPPRIHRGPLRRKVGSSTNPIDGSEYSGSFCTLLFLDYLDIAFFIYCAQLALSLLFTRNSSTSASVTGFSSPGKDFDKAL
jgi:hypothetical protein